MLVKELKLLQLVTGWPESNNFEQIDPNIGEHKAHRFCGWIPELYIEFVAVASCVDMSDNSDTALQQASLSPSENLKSSSKR